MLTSEEYRAVFEAAPDGVLVVCRDGRIRDLNPQIETMFGYAREELLGELVETLVPDAHREGHAAQRERYRRNPHARPMGIGMELQGRRRDGSLFPVEISLSPWETELEGGMRVVCTVRDITDRKRLQDFSEGALRSVEEERQRIARELHDDTAQRLATLMLRLRLLGQVSSDQERVRYIETLRDDILETAEGVKRIARGLRPPELEDVGLSSALRAHLRGLREGAGLRVDADIQDVGTLLSEEAKLALYRIVQEALSNVVRHSGADFARLRIEQMGDHVEAEIADGGRGFFAGRTRERGAGLGLIGMQERALMVGGRVTVDSSPGEGTRVRIEFPVTAVEATNV